MPQLFSSSNCLLGYYQDFLTRARKQFKGLFDKKPGEIAEVADNDGGEIADEKDESDNQDDLVGHEENVGQDTAQVPVGLMSRLLPKARRFIANLGLNRCTIL